MPAQYPGIGFPPDSEVSLLRKITNNLALIAAAGGSPPPASVQQTGSVDLVPGTQSYAIVFGTPFASAPSFVGATVQMPNDSGEALFADPDLSTLTASGVTVWLNGVPTAQSIGGKINWVANI